MKAVFLLLFLSVTICQSLPQLNINNATDGTKTIIEKPLGILDPLSITQGNGTNSGSGANSGIILKPTCGCIEQILMLESHIQKQDTLINQLTEKVNQNAAGMNADVLMKLMAMEQRLMVLEATPQPTSPTTTTTTTMTTTTPKPTVCQAGYKQYKDQCYRIVNEYLTWHQARQRCMLEGGDLARDKSSDIHQFLSNFMNGAGVVRGAKDNRGLWIGGHDMPSEGQWLWVYDDSRMTFTAWDDDGPDDAKKHSDSGEDCLELYFDNRGNRWNDQVCNSQVNGFICQKQLK